MEALGDQKIVTGFTEAHKSKHGPMAYELAKKFLPPECVHRIDDKNFRTEILLTISKCAENESGIIDLRQICQLCPFVKICVIYRN